MLTELTKRASKHFCRIEDKGRFGTFNYVVMTLVGKSMQDLRKGTPQQHFSMGTAIGCGIQTLEALEDLHGIGYLHRDIKPGNYSIGRAELNELRKVYISVRGVLANCGRDFIASFPNSAIFTQKFQDIIKLKYLLNDYWWRTPEKDK